MQRYDVFQPHSKLFPHFLFRNYGQSPRLWTKRQSTACFCPKPVFLGAKKEDAPCSEHILIRIIYHDRNSVALIVEDQCRLWTDGGVGALDGAEALLVDRAVAADNLIAPFGDSDLRSRLAGIEDDDDVAPVNSR